MVTKHDPPAVLSRDLLPWEPQPDETDAAYQAFKEFLDSDKRRVSDHGPSAKNWSARYRWSHRAQEFDIYMSRVDLEEQVRYRRKMNERHRRMAAVALSKVVKWLEGLDPARMSVADAIRLLDVAVRIEQVATCVVGVEDLPEPYSAPARGNGSIKQRLIEAGLNVDMSELANQLHKVMYPSQDRAERPTEEPPIGPSAEPPAGPSIWGKAVDEPTPDIFGAG
jgi:hypothetical protein